MSFTNHTSNNLNQRRWINSSSAFSSNSLHFVSPWVTLWWSLAFPGFGHLLTNHILWGSILISFEFVINNLGHINQAIFYSMIGEIDKAKELLVFKWAFFYTTVYIFAVFDSYRRCVDSNKDYQLAYRETKQLQPFQLSPYEVNPLEKKKPWIAWIWSFFMPGLGLFYLQRIFSFIVIFFWWWVLIFYSNIYESIYFSMIGKVDLAKHYLRPEWALFIPSIGAFATYLTYQETVENNKLFEKELARYLKDNFQEGCLDELYS